MIISVSRLNKLFIWLIILITVMIFSTVNSVSALDTGYAHESTGIWYRIRTNSVPYQPAAVIADPAGQLWMTSMSEYAPGVWQRSGSGTFTYITSDTKNNYINNGLTLISKAQLDAEVIYASRDSQGNNWYALKNGKLLCEKANGTWVPVTASYTVDSGCQQKIRHFTAAGNNPRNLWISTKGITLLDNTGAAIATRPAATDYNNDFINDVLVDSQGRFWVATGRGVERGTALLNTTAVSVLFPDTSLVPPWENPILSLSEDSAGNVWMIGNGGEVYCCTTADTWVKYDSTNCPQMGGRRSQCLTADQSGNVWFGLYYGGLLKYSPATAGGSPVWTHYSCSTFGLQSEDVISMANTNNGLWFMTGYNPEVTGNGTGVHCLTYNGEETPSLLSYTYRSSSTTLTSLRFKYIAADQNGGVWFPAYDDPSVARLLPDGSWRQYRSGVNGVDLGSFGIAGIGIDSKNIVYLAPTNQPPRAYDINREQWITLPIADSLYPYGIYVDPLDGKWFYAAYGVYYLSPDNSNWIKYTTADGLAGDYTDVGVLMDSPQNVWFMGRSGVNVMKKATAGASPVWLTFTNATGNASNFKGGYRVYCDNNGEIWNAQKQKFDYSQNTWQDMADTSTLDHRSLRFLNGDVPADLDMSQALSPINGLDQDNMTLDTNGNIYFSGGMSGGINSVDNGIVVYRPAHQQSLTVIPAINSIQANVGTSRAALPLPTQIPVTLSSGYSTCRVSWDNGTPAYNPLQAGNYQFSGTVVLPIGVGNPSNLKAQVTAVVHDPAAENKVALLTSAINNSPGPGDYFSASSSFNTVKVTIKSDKLNYSLQNSFSVAAVLTTLTGLNNSCTIDSITIASRIFTHEDLFTHIWSQASNIQNAVLALANKDASTKYQDLKLKDLAGKSLQVVMDGQPVIIEVAPPDECFIATAAFGSKLIWPVALLRNFRDEYLMTSSLGQSLVSFYYDYSPPIAAFIAGKPVMQMMVRLLLAPLIAGVYIIYHPILWLGLLVIICCLAWRRQYLKAETM